MSWKVKVKENDKSHNRETEGVNWHHYELLMKVKHCGSFSPCHLRHSVHIYNLYSLEAPDNIALVYNRA